MAYSYVLYTGNGTTTNFTFPFAYLNADNIKVRVNGVLTEYTFLNESTVTISPAPADGSVIEIRRETITPEAPVDFADGSVLLEKDLDLLAKYNLFASQEAFDIASDSMTTDSSGNLDAEGRRIVNLANPVDGGDAVNKQTLQYEYPKVATVADGISAVYTVAADLGAAVTYESDLGSITDPVTTDDLAGDSRIITVAENITDIIDVANNLSVIQAADDNALAAASSASSAASSASTATTQAGIATTKASEASASATAAAGSATSASTSASTATTKANQASTSASNAAASEAIASTAATDAGTSAINAQTSATNAANSATSASNSASNASASASTASNAANTATTQATAASSSASSAASSATSASGSASTATTKAAEASAAASDSALSAGLANEWATKTSGPVAGGEFSAKYHANAAISSASSATSSASSASSSASAAASSATAASASASDAAASAAAAATALDNFDDRYLGPKNTAPTVDNDGNALLSGALYFNTGLSVAADKGMWAYDGIQWIKASSAAQAALAVYKFTATGGQTTFSGASANGTTLSYIPNGLVVSLNGVVLVGGGDDYTASNGTSVVLTTGATSGDVLEVYAFSSFSIASLNGASIVDDSISADKLAPIFDLGSI